MRKLFNISVYVSTFAWIVSFVPTIGIIVAPWVMNVDTAIYVLAYVFASGLGIILRLGVEWNVWTRNIYTVTLMPISWSFFGWLYLMFVNWSMGGV